jgi:hypothetical protein
VRARVGRVQLVEAKQPGTLVWIGIPRKGAILVIRHMLHESPDERPGRVALTENLNALPPERRAKVEDFVDFLSAKAEKRAALDRLLATAPAREAAGTAPMSMRS